MAALFRYAGYILIFAAVLGVGCSAPTGAADKDFTKGAKVLLLGDSLLAGHRGDNRVENVMSKQLKTLYPKAAFEVVNKARGGMWIGPADASKARGVSKPLLGEEGKDWYARVRKECPEADAVIIEFSGNDGKVYSPEDFGKKLAGLCDKLAKDYPNAKIFLSTGMYLDPKHSGGYYRRPSMVKGFKQGSNRNEYLAPYYDEIRALAKKRSYALADICKRIKAETDAGNWDLRIRARGGDPKDDDKHKGDMRWFGDIHPNPRGTEVMADVYVKTLLGKDALTPSPKKDVK